MLSFRSGGGGAAVCLELTQSGVSWFVSVIIWLLTDKSKHSAFSALFMYSDLLGSVNRHPLCTSNPSATQTALFTFNTPFVRRECVSPSSVQVVYMLWNVTKAVRNTDWSLTLENNNNPL